MSADVERWRNLPQDHLARSKKLPWYNATFDGKLTNSFQELLQAWSGVPREEIPSHIVRVREEAWAIFPWPCIGEFWFLEQGLLRHPDYSRVLRQLISDENQNTTFLDLGTCLGQDIRTLANDGAPLRSLYGADLLPAFEAAGHSLFRDSDRFTSTHFISGDVFSDEDKLATTRGSWNMIHIAMFLHVFSLDDQERACSNILKLLKPAPGSFIIGTQTGNTQAQEVVLRPPMCDAGEHKTVFRQSKDTLQDMWQRVALSMNYKIVAWTAYDDARVDRQAQRREEQADRDGSPQRFFTGKGERRIFFRVELM